MRLGLTKLDRGLFPAALDDINQSLGELVASEETPTRRQEVRACCSYKRALKILIEIKLLEASKNVNRIAQLASFLADVPIRPPHRVICMRFALQKNLQVANYGIAAKFIKILLQRDLPDQADLHEKLRECKDHDFSNSTATMNNEKVRFCHQSFVPLINCAIIHCPYCDALFSEKVKRANEICVFCTIGSLKKILPGQALPITIP